MSTIVIVYFYTICAFSQATRKRIAYPQGAINECLHWIPFIDWLIIPQLVGAEHLFKNRTSLHIVYPPYGRRRFSVVCSSPCRNCVLPRPVEFNPHHHFLKVHFNIVLPHSSYIEWSLSFGFAINILCTFPYVPYMIFLPPKYIVSHCVYFFLLS